MQHSPGHGSRSALSSWLLSAIWPAVAVAVMASVPLMCGDNQPIGKSPFNATPTPRHAPTATHQPAPTATPDRTHFEIANQTASETVSGISIHLVGLDGVFSIGELGANCGSNPVFTTSAPSSLSSSNVDQIRSYLNQLPTGPDFSPIPSPALKPPSGLNWIPDGTACTVRLELTNMTTQSGIEIRSLGLQLASASLPVSVPPIGYSRVDVCTFVPTLVPCENGIGATGLSSNYVETIGLGSGDAGRIFSGPLELGPAAKASGYSLPFLLKPGVPRDVDLTITVPEGTDLAYQVVPELEVGTSTTPLPFNALSTNLSFAKWPTAAQRWPCYGALTSTDRLVPESQVPYQAPLQGWCI